ncbi:ATP-binding protein [Actinoplanes sp. NPDC051851]|uniref:ATP-binding protein n=1 Tax=Actinoplanes sp. NPDC051851 TaxID=3154753 RepID=UPI003443F308
MRVLRAGLERAVTDHTVKTDRQDLTERITIVATELAGNALRHGRPPTVVLLRRTEGHLVVEVLDSDVDATPAVDSQRPSGDGGLGLLLTERLAHDVGWYATGTGGKGVWAAFALAR